MCEEANKEAFHRSFGIILLRLLVHDFQTLNETVFIFTFEPCLVSRGAGQGTQTVLLLCGDDVLFVDS